jgi:hypothetical protein
MSNTDFNVLKLVYSTPEMQQALYLVTLSTVTLMYHL